MMIKQVPLSTPPSWDSLVEILRWRADHQSDQPAFTFLPDGETNEQTLTYGDLDLQARAIAAQLQARGLQNQPVLLIYPHSLDYVVAFFACLYAGAIAVPIYPPRNNRSLNRVVAVAEDAGASTVLTTDQVLENFVSTSKGNTSNDLTALEQLTWIPTTTVDTQQAHKWQPHYQLWQESFADRIAIVLGDVSQPLLGVAPPVFTELAQGMDVVFHNAALTNFAYSYEQMKPVNVQGTHEALRLASQERTKLFQYISTIGVFEPLVFSPAVITEQHEPASTGLSRGYTQSKWVAERMVVMAQERGLPVTLYRPPIIGGDSHTGQPNSGDFVWNFIQACVEMEYAPILPALEMHISPVDYVANASVALAQKLVAGKVFHLTNPYPAMTWRQFCDILRGRGYTLATLPFDAWLNACKQRAKEHDDRERLLLAATIEDLQPIFERLARPGSMAQIDCANTLHYLEDSAIRCPPPEQLFSTYAARVEA